MPSDRELIINMLIATAPEYEAKIRDIWSDCDPKIEFVVQRKGVVMNADRSRIQFDLKLIDIFWLCGFGAWKAVDVYEKPLRQACANGTSIGAAFRNDAEFDDFERDFKELVSTADYFFRNDIDVDRWPPSVPEPSPERDPINDPVYKANFDLVIFALSFCWFHELRHVMFRKEGTALSRPEEELACDRWARNLMTANVGSFAKSSGYSYDDLLRKRAIAVSLGAFIVHLMTPTLSRFGNAEYPSLSVRIKELIGTFDFDERDYFWTFTACVLIGLMRFEHRALVFAVESPKHAVKTMLDLI